MEKDSLFIQAIHQQDVGGTNVAVAKLFKLLNQTFHAMTKKHSDQVSLEIGFYRSWSGAHLECLSEMGVTSFCLFIVLIPQIECICSNTIHSYVQHLPRGTVR